MKPPLLPPQEKKSSLTRVAYAMAGLSCYAADGVVLYQLIDHVLKIPPAVPLLTVLKQNAHSIAASLALSALALDCFLHSAGTPQKPGPSHTITEIKGNDITIIHMGPNPPDIGDAAREALRCL